MSANIPEAALDLAIRLADAARPIVMKYFRAPLDIEIKDDASPVTIADREAESVMRELIEKTFPDHGIHGEEHGAIRMDSEFIWVLDPIDGTKSFVTGKPTFGTLIGLVKNGRPVLGIIDMPALNERWIGCAGAQSTFNGVQAQVRPCGELGQAWLYATSPHMFPTGDFDAFERLRKQAHNITYGADCMAYGLLASGHIDLVAEAAMGIHDYCALVPVIEGAGGVISDWQGEALGLESDGRILAAGDARTYAAALKILNP
ncbi:MAG: histidinol-phosphatase [Rhodospirillaceae bacterium]|nr:histidinol-phosphatase [Rhodospirillaceae bacterium]